MPLRSRKMRVLMGQCVVVMLMVLTVLPMDMGMGMGVYMLMGVDRISVRMGVCMNMMML